MGEKNGFIATSLIYSFFLAFVAIIMALVNSYIANKTIMNRFNDGITENLDNSPLTVAIFSEDSLTTTTSGFKNGMLVNKITNGNFNSSLDGWSKTGTVTVDPAESLVTLSSGSASSYISQNIHLEKDHIYFISAMYFQPIHTVSLDIGFEGDTNISKTHKTGTMGWVKVSKRYKATSTEDKSFVVGRNTSNSYTSFTQFKDIMVIDITKDLVTNDFSDLDEDWLRNSIEWFDTRFYYVINNAVLYGSSISVTLLNYNTSEVTCSNRYGRIGSSKDISENTSIINISSTLGDTSCQVKSGGS